jgi:hypothetical protein
VIDNKNPAAFSCVMLYFKPAESDLFKLRVFQLLLMNYTAQEVQNLVNDGSHFHEYVLLEASEILPPYSGGEPVQ